MPVHESTVPLGGFSGVDPEKGGLTDFWADRNFYDQVMDSSPGWMSTDLIFALEVVQNPSEIFTGLRRTGFENAWAYCGVPKNPPQPGVLTVFVAKIERRGFSPDFLVFGMQWREEDPQERGLPLNWNDDFGGREPRWRLNH